MRRNQLMACLLVVWAADAAATAAAPATRAKLVLYSGSMVVGVTFEGNRVTKDYVIRREIRTAVGDTLSPELVARDVERLDNLGIFAQVVASVTEYSHGVVVHFVVREMPWIFPYPALGYTEENGWSVGPAASSVNLFGQAMTLNGSVLVGGTAAFELSYRWPWITGNHINFELNASRLVRDQTILEFSEESYEVSPWFGTWLGEHGRLSAMVGWFQMNSDSEGRTLAAGTDNLFRVGARLGLDTRDSWRNPHNGWWNELQVIKTGRPLPGDGDFWTLDLDLQRYQPLARRHTLVAGWLTTLQSGQVGVDVPPYLQYFLGGANSIRGYDFGVLGRELFGKNQVIVTVEYQYLVTDIRPIRLWKWAIAAGLEVAAFTDTGIAWEADPRLGSEGSLAWDRAKTGVGVGLRLLLPSVEVVRVDAAVGEGGSFQFHFAVWPKLYAQRLRVR